jgi:hypothetical protein
MTSSGQTLRQVLLLIYRLYYLIIQVYMLINYNGVIL